ncbi:hypothetical protein [Microbispora sp. GKU 823]|uniref:hypothetical protein n=1 Tax=Microbispora sp. GKU 823 TaxID=1652100 RepID=UPI00117FE0AA|nr:hypothetical protein [Microbispora sp. GKU 823]
MGDAEAFTRGFLPLFHAVPPVRLGVCRICHSGPNNRGDGKPWPTCASCKRTTQNLTGYTENVVPISLTTKETQLYDVLVREKTPYGVTGRRSRVDFLAATVTHFYQKHAGCLRGLAGGSFTIVATIPSTGAERPVQAFPLMDAVVGKVSALARLFRPLLLQADGEFAPVLAARKSHSNAFRVRGGELNGERVLLVNDLFVSGAHLQSAASALIAKGAQTVVALVVARLMNPASTDPYSAKIWQESCDRPFSFDRCCVCESACGRAA